MCEMTKLEELKATINSLKTVSELSKTQILNKLSLLEQKIEIIERRQRLIPPLFR